MNRDDIQKRVEVLEHHITQRVRDLSDADPQAQRLIGQKEAYLDVLDKEPREGGE